MASTPTEETAALDLEDVRLGTELRVQSISVRVSRQRHALCVLAAMVAAPVIITAMATRAGRRVPHAPAVLPPTSPAPPELPPVPPAYPLTPVDRLNA
eukprot:1658486-Prymnesium_polylepis.1